jgi:hypothetical protein
MWELIPYFLLPVLGMAWYLDRMKYRHRPTQEEELRSLLESVFSIVKPIRTIGLRVQATLERLDKVDAILAIMEENAATLSKAPKALPRPAQQGFELPGCKGKYQVLDLDNVVQYDGDDLVQAKQARTRYPGSALIVDGVNRG